MPGVLIQPRDLAIFQSLSTARFLTAEAIEWLHFPQWPTRYRTWRQQCDAGTAAAERYYPATWVYFRLRKLKDVGMIGSIGTTVDAAASVISSMDSAYFLTERGAEQLAARSGQDFDDLWWETTAKKRSVQNLAHSMAIGRAYAALRSAVERDGQEMTAWQGDHQLNAPQQYDRIPIASQREPVPLAPDATFLLGSWRYFVELDRGTRPLRSWSEKAQGYWAYRQHRLLRDRYGCQDFTLLIIAPTAQRLRRIAETVAQAAQGGEPGVWLLEDDHLHPHRVRANWEQVVSATATRRLALGTQITVYQPQLATTALWEKRDGDVRNAAAQQGH